MSITKEHKQEIINSFKRSDTDSGSPEVQIAMQSAQIQSLQHHLKVHPKDNSSKRGLIKTVNARRKQLKYLKRKNLAVYKTTIESLKIRG